MWREYNPNPTGRRVEDCAIRAVAKALDWDWEKAYATICSYGFAMGDMPHSNSVWGAVLRENGFVRKSIPEACPDCYTADGGSMRGGSYRGSYDGGSYDGSYDGGSMRGGSYARGRGRNARRDSRGRYSSGNDMMMEELQGLMEEAPDGRTREEIQKLIQRMGQM